MAALQHIKDADANTTTLKLLTNNGNGMQPALTIDSSGNVGIGSSSPSGTFHISSGTSGDCVLILEADTDNDNENDNPRIEFKQDGGVSHSAITNGNNELCLYNSSNSGKIIFYVSNVEGYENGIPRAYFGYDGDDVNVGSLYLLNNSSTSVLSGSKLGEILFRGYSAQDGSDTSPVSIYGEADGNVTDSTHAGAIVLATASTGNRLERMRVTKDGYVGIGETTPNEKLVVDGENVIFKNSAAGKNNLLYIEMNNHANGVDIEAMDADNTNNKKNITLCAYGSGNVGIGTTTPLAKLHCKSPGTNVGAALENFNEAQLILTNANNDHYAIAVHSGGNASLAFHREQSTSSPGINGFDEMAYISGLGNNQQLNFTGQHRNILNNTINDSSTGLIVSATNNHINLDNSITSTINESLPYCILANTDNDKKVFGVISDKEDTTIRREYSTGNFVSVYQKTNTNEQRFFINSVGEGSIWVCNKNGTLDNGDYITSTTVTGYGGKQSDDILHNYTVAKITRDCDFSLTKIVKQKLKVITSTDSDGNTTTSIDYDANGDVQYEDDLDENGNQQMVYPLETRFLQSDGTLLTDEAEYNTRLGNGEEVYIACFVGCTYHCG